MDDDPYLDHFASCTDLMLAMLALRNVASDQAEQLVEDLAAAQRQIATRLEAHPELALLERRLGLTQTEMFVVWLLAAAAARSEVRTALARFSTGPSPDPTLDVIRSLIYGDRPSRAALQELGPSGRLRSLAVIERSDGGGREVHESRQTWTIARRVLALLHGDLGLDPAIAHLASDSPAGSPDSLAVDPAALRGVRDAMRLGRAVVIVSGMPGLGRRTLLSAACREAGKRPIAIDARMFSSDRITMASQCQLLARECKLLDLVPVVTSVDALVDEDGTRLDVVGRDLVSRLDGLVLVTAGLRRPTIRWDRPAVAVEMQQPSSSQRGRLWLETLGDGSAEDAELLATNYPLAPAMIHRAASAARLRVHDRQLEDTDVYAGIRTVLDDQLGQYARRVTVSQTWDDLVLAKDQIYCVAELMTRVRERRRVYEQWGFAAKVGKGLGVSALFSGPPGTGKTMVAALIAQDLGLELYQVDLAKVVSKWIGETEKNLAAVFDAAEAGHAILLFDEADALFGKRTDVKSSNDRHANLETNYMLQRLESFTGICLLTSNHETNIDPAFLRRLSLHLRFEMPDASERSNLWRAMLPEQAPTAGDLDFDALGAKFEMSGGYIRNAALRAAFLAANRGEAISFVHLSHAARLECEGMGKIVV